MANVYKIIAQAAAKENGADLQRFGKVLPMGTPVEMQLPASAIYALIEDPLVLVAPDISLPPRSLSVFPPPIETPAPAQEVPAYANLPANPA